MDSKFITVAQFQEFAKKADERLDKVELGKLDKAGICTVSIPVSAWVTNTDEVTVNAGFAYCADVAVSDLSAEDSVDTVLDFASYEAAKVCGMAVTSMINDGAVRYFAVKQPSEAITAQLRVIRCATE